MLCVDSTHMSHVPCRLLTVSIVDEFIKRTVVTIPGVEHVSDEVVDEGDLGLGNAAGVPVKDGHYHRHALSLLLICL